MPRARHDVNGASPFGPNRTAVESLIASRDGWSAGDEPIIAQARSLADAVDENPSAHALASEYRRTLALLRDTEQSSAARDWHDLLRSLQECHRTDGPYATMHDGDEVWCQGCVVEFIVDHLGHDEFRDKVGLIQDGIYAISQGRPVGWRPY